MTCNVLATTAVLTALAVALSTGLPSQAAPETTTFPAALTTGIPGHSEPGSTTAPRVQTALRLRSNIAPLVVSAQDKLHNADYPGAIGDLNRVMAQAPTPFELGLALTLRGGARYTRGDLEGARADWTRALDEGVLDAATQLHLVQNIELLDDALR